MENSAIGCWPLVVGEPDICRICRKTHEDYLNIFVSNEEFKLSIGKAIGELLVLEVAQGDSFLETVCCPCVTKLKEFRDISEIRFKSARKLAGRPSVNVSNHAAIQESLHAPGKKVFVVMKM